ncbi:flavin reductase [Streptomyces sp. ms191]|uniref:flavin reductase family protein n=1 Tax=unclassified Streptomyces TaxID=2593676 RepID=UPI0011CD3F62|nr:flavin reductase family protein [Streptomyces sp. ms191]TXS22007.1 flavin reductase [Streptomyces sp. ms191]
MTITTTPSATGQPVTRGPGVPQSALDGLFRSAFRRHPAGVAVVTVRGGDGRPYGFTATSVVSVSAAPPMLALAVGTDASTWPALATATHLGVHLLDEGQSALAALFARSGADRFGGADWEPGPWGVPQLTGCPVRLVCRVAGRVPAGDHRIVVAELLTGDCPPGDRPPLLYHAGRFAGLRPLDPAAPRAGHGS